MAIIPWFYEQATKGFRNEPARKIKDALRPVKHAIVGKRGLYQAIDMVKERAKNKGTEVRVVFDVGAAIGEAALPLAKAFPVAQIYCFEPLPESYALLVERTRNFRNRVHCFNYGLHERPGELKFYVNEDHHDASSLIPPPESWKRHEISIPVKRLDDVCRELGITHIDFMKVDVEGMEKEALGGAREILCHTDSAFVEISPWRKGYNHDYIDVFESLYAAGLAFVGVYDDYFFTRQ
ncbi:MAG TPA: FkbM family methyltransferase [Candidatus Paceibacterota bacterium]|nr:FkbM family methyltransferase [Candidatus Paceibacterota bacterium]